jgi:predicted RNA binding protein YcfA (HicA-like mRNA interferase family)
MLCRGEYKVLEEVALAQGWQVQKTKNNHIKFMAPNGVGLVIVSSTPSDHRGHHKARSDLRRAGLKI